jgi:DNA-binding transcriptional LysR family regulator
VIDVGSGAAFVGEGLGVAVLPRFAVPESLGVALLTVADADLDWPLGVATSAMRARRPARCWRWSTITSLDVIPPHGAHATSEPVAAGRQ